MQQSTEPDFLKLVGQFVETRVQLAVKNAITPLLQKIYDLETKAKELESGWSGDMKAVRDTFGSYVMLEDFTKSVDEQKVRDLIDARITSDMDCGLLANFDDVIGHCGILFREQLKELNLATGEPGEKLSPVVPRDGKDGKDGKDADMPALLEMCKAWAVSSVLKLYEDGAVKNGKGGENGKDGADGKSVEISDILPVLTDLVGKAVAALPVSVHVVDGLIDRDGHLCLTLSDGKTKRLGIVVGRDGVDGTPGRDGADGLGFKDMSVVWDGERTIMFKFVLEERTEELSIKLPFVLYRGVWKDGTYERGDSVTRSSSMWVAVCDTDKMPGTVDSGWVLSAKKGGDGRDGKDGKNGLNGKDGKDGRDLTQMTFSGEKY